MNIILIAAPAAGKGTIAQLLHEEYGFTSLSAGELLRGVDPNTELGARIRDIQSKGLLVDDDITASLMKQKLSECKESNIILDGYPRRMEQVHDLEKISAELNFEVDYAVYLKVDYETALKRTIGRRICPECKMTYNVLTGFNTPLKENTCNYCNAILTTRNDDNEDSLKVRFTFFNENTLPVVEYYGSIGKLIEVDASLDANMVLANLKESLGVKND